MISMTSWKNRLRRMLFFDELEPLVGQTPLYGRLWVKLRHCRMGTMGSIEKLLIETVIAKTVGQLDAEPNEDDLARLASEIAPEFAENYCEHSCEPHQKGRSARIEAVSTANGKDLKRDLASIGQSLSTCSN